MFTFPVEKSGVGRFVFLQNVCRKKENAIGGGKINSEVCKSPGVLGFKKEKKKKTLNTSHFYCELLICDYSWCITTQLVNNSLHFLA